MPPNDSQRLRRLLRLIQCLSQALDGVSVQDFAAQEGLDEKTIRRDLMLLKNMGLPLEERLAKFGRKLWLIRSEAENSQFNIFEGQSASERTEEEVVNQSASVPTELSEMLFFSTAGTNDYSRRTHLITTILQSITQRQALQLTYRKPSESVSLQYIIHPYSLAAHHGSLYVVARNVAAGAIRHFNLDKIDGAETLSEKYRIPRNFNVETYFQSTFGIFSPGKEQYRVEIEFFGSASETVKNSCWHTTQKFHDQKDGTTVMHVVLNDLQEVKSWVLSFGALARVLHPPELVAMVRQEVVLLLQAYT
jgi:predicted DNA-binding transcriptional regulator YafY